MEAVIVADDPLFVLYTARALRFKPIRLRKRCRSVRRRGDPRLVENQDCAFVMIRDAAASSKMQQRANTVATLHREVRRAAEVIDELRAVNGCRCAASSNCSITCGTPGRPPCLPERVARRRSR